MAPVKHLTATMEQTGFQWQTWNCWIK